MTVSGVNAAFFEKTGAAAHMVLATAGNNSRVSARTMSVVRLGDRFYFQIDGDSRKAAQLRENPRAALCLGNLQIEGVCREIGRPQEHKAFCAAYRAAFPSTFDRYTHLECERLWEFAPDFAKKWIYEGGEPFEEILDPASGILEKKKYERE